MRGRGGGGGGRERVERGGREWEEYRRRDKIVDLRWIQKNKQNRIEKISMIKAK